MPLAMPLPARRRATALLALLLALLTGCRAGTSNQLRRTIISEVVAGSEIAPNLRALCMPGGRLSGSPNGALAEQYVAGKLGEYGLSNVHFEPFNMTTWRDRTTEVAVLDDPPVNLRPVQALGNSMTTPPEGITGELVDVGQGAEDDFKAKADLLEGRFALAHDGGPHRSRKMKYALERGALGMLLASELEDQVVVGVCHDQPKPQPGVAVCKADGDKLAARLAAGETVKINVKVEADVWECRPRNVVGEIPGAGPTAGEVVLLCAHLDSWHLAEGAVDNGSGAATVLEAARVLAGLHLQPRRTIRFVWFMGEEHGLLGSEHYVKEHAADLDRIVAVVNVDMPGSPRQIVSFGHPEVNDLLQSVCESLPGLDISQGLVEAKGAGSDHAPFMYQGVCCLALHGDAGPGAKFYHSRHDTYEQVDRRGLSESATVLAVLAQRLANSPARPGRRLPPPTDAATSHGQR